MVSESSYLQEERSLDEEYRRILEEERKINKFIDERIRPLETELSLFDRRLKFKLQQIEFLRKQV